MTKRTTYTDEFRQEAVRLLHESGKSARQLGRELGASIRLKLVETPGR